MLALIDGGSPRDAGKSGSAPSDDSPLGGVYGASLSPRVKGFDFVDT